jgi:hypothetical protein
VYGSGFVSKSPITEVELKVMLLETAGSARKV